MFHIVRLPILGLVSWVLFMATGLGCATTNGAWRSVLEERLPVYGHRNLIAVVDSAYPAQSRPGVETVATGELQTTVVRAVLAALHEARHVRPRVYLDRELDFVAEADAPGITAYRKELKALLADLPVESLSHENIIAKLDDTAQHFNVLVLKSNMILPYTSVFIQLECGYWTDDAERRLRSALGAQQP